MTCALRESTLLTAFSDWKGSPEEACPRRWHPRPRAWTRTRPSLLRRQCPYRGLRVFDVDDAPFFFGREALVQWLLNELRPATEGQPVNRFCSWPFSKATPAWFGATWNQSRRCWHFFPTRCLPRLAIHLRHPTGSSTEIDTGDIG